MKAKMPNKPGEAGKYLCMHCNKQFHFQTGQLTCPFCKNYRRSELVLIDVRDNRQEENLYTAVDWHGG